MDINKTQPPRWANRFLEWYCRPDLLEEIQGDAYEIYIRTAQKNKRKADLQFVWNIIMFFRWKNIKRKKNKFTSNYTIMLRNYLIIGFRNAIRHRLNSSINIIGLSLAIGCAITAYIFIDHQLNADTFHTNIDRIYQVTNMIKTENTYEEWSDSPILLGPSLKSSETGVEAMTRVEFANAAVRYNETVLNEFIWFVDAEFTTMFDFPLLKGNAQSLERKNTIILFKDLAEKYFGTTDPIGQVLSIKFSNETKEEFIVGAVLERPDNSSLYPSALLSMLKFEDLKFKDIYDWSYQTDATFIMLKPSYSVQQFDASMNQFKILQNQASPEWIVDEYRFNSLRGLSSKGQAIISAVSSGAHPSGLLALGVTALILLILACFNYMNVAVATAATRLKEIGIRKVIGGRKSEIVHQFITENFLMCAFALVVGISLSYLLFLPAFNSLYPINTPFVFSSTKNAIYFFGGLLIFIGFASGAYPAFYISSFTPIKIMRGREKFGQRSVFSRILLTVQFILAFTAIVGSFVFIDNAIFLKNRDWGYDHEQNLVVPVGDKEKFLALRDKVEAQKHIVSIAGSANHIGHQNTRSSFEYDGKRFETINYQVGFGYLETMNIRLKQGRFFSESIQSDHTESVVVNERFVKMMGWNEPLEQTLIFDSLKRYVVGVVSDFHYTGFYGQLGPVMFTIVPEQDFRYLTAKTETGYINDMNDFLKTAWREVSPDDPFQGFLQNEVLNNFYNDNTANIKLLSTISGLAIILGCLGLFGLVSFNITRRQKEFSVRKVFGANLFQIFNLMSKDYMWILIVAFGLGAPSGFFLINSLIQLIYPDPQAASLLPFIIAILMMLVTVGITVGSQMSRITKENPAKTLRMD